MKYLYKDKKFFILSIVWSSFFFSIGLNPIEFYEYDILSKIRLSLPFILSCILIIYFFKEFKISKIYTLPYILFFIIFFLYAYFNLINLSNNNYNLFWPTYMFLSLFILQSFTNFKEKVLLLKVAVTIIVFAFIFYLLSGVTDSAINRNSFHLYGIMGSQVSYAGLENAPRSSGLARLSLILFTFLTLHYILNNKVGNYKLLISIFFLALISLLFHSRTVSFIFLIINFLFIFFYFKKFFLDKRLIFCAIFFPVLINIFYSFVIDIYVNKYQVGDSTLLTITKNSLFRNTEYKKFSDKEEQMETFSSGRFGNWRTAYDIISKNPLKGYGPQADRILIEKQSIHNALLYAALSGGLISGILIFLIYLYCIWLLIKFFFINRLALYKNYESNFCAFLIIIFCLRSLLETSFAIFSIDFLLFILAISLLNNHLLTYKN